MGRKKGNANFANIVYVVGNSCNENDIHIQWS